jgi:hypothetical protein
MGRTRKGNRERIRWYEIGNKIAAYRLFAGRNHAGSPMNVDGICALDPYPRMFAAEGYGYRMARQGEMAKALPPGLNPISVHAGAGLWLAEQTLKKLKVAGSDVGALDEFSDVCRQKASDGFGGIMEEALGLVARTLYPHLMDPLDERLREMDTGLWERFWHGMGRGIYFAPSNFSPSRAVPWSGVGMCLQEAPDDTAKRNALSGFCFAVTLVNLRQPEILEAFFQHHAAESTGCTHGVQSAMSVWNLSGGCGEINERLAAYVPSAAGTHTLCELLQQRSVSLEDGRRPERLFALRQPATYRAGARIEERLASFRNRSHPYRDCEVNP